MKKNELKPDAIGLQHLWWLKRTDGPIGGARNSVRVGVVAMSDWYKGPSNTTASSLDVKNIKTGKIERQAIQLLQVMTNAEKAEFYEEWDAEKALNNPVQKSAEKLPNTIARRDAVAREIAKDFGISIAQANRNLRQVEQTLEKILLEGTRIVLQDFLFLDLQQRSARKLIHVRSKQEVVLPPCLRLKVTPGKGLARKIKAMGVAK